MRIADVCFHRKVLSATDTFAFDNDCNKGVLRNAGDVDVQLWKTDSNKFFTLKAGEKIDIGFVPGQVIQTSGAATLELFCWGES